MCLIALAAASGGSARQSHDYQNGSLVFWEGGDSNAHAKMDHPVSLVMSGDCFAVTGT